MNCRTQHFLDFRKLHLTTRAGAIKQLGFTTIQTHFQR